HRTLSLVPLSDSSRHFSLFFFYSYADHRDLHSFPTRRSSDLRDFQLSRWQQRRARQEFFTRVPGQGNQAGAALRCNQHDLLPRTDRKSTRLNSSHVSISYAVFCLKKKKKKKIKNKNTNTLTKT